MSGPESFDGKFEQEWREAFENYSQEPPKVIWENIDKKLTYDKMLYYKKSARVFQYLTAAVVLLACFLWLNISFPLNGGSDIDTTISAIDHPKYLSSNIPSVEICDIDNHNNTVITDKTNIDSGKKNFGFDENKVAPNIFLASDEKNKKSGYNNISEIYTDLQPIKPDNTIGIPSNHRQVDMWYAADYSYLNKSKAEKKSSSKKKLWAGVDFGSSNFDPNYQGTTNATLNNSVSLNTSQFSGARTDAIESVSPNVEETMSAGNSISLGLNFGLALDDRWSLSSGLIYNMSEATNSTNLVVKSSKVKEAIPASQEFKNINQVNNAVNSNQVVEYDYQNVYLSNEFQFASLPVRAGYKVLNSKFSMEINAGVAANLYLGNKLTDPTSEFADVIIGPGSESSYKEVSFSGLAGLQLGYLFLDKFELVVQPNYQQSLNSLTKESSEFQATPSGFGLLTGLRYRFQ